MACCSTERELVCNKPIRRRLRFCSDKQAVLARSHMDKRRTRRRRRRQRQKQTQIDHFALTLLGRGRRGAYRPRAIPEITDLRRCFIIDKKLTMRSTIIKRMETNNQPHLHRSHCVRHRYPRPTTKVIIHINYINYIKNA